jgi:hypothetical protein
MNEHPQIQAQLTVYHELDAHERQQIEQHLRTCLECAETLAAYTAMDQAMHRLVDDKLRYLATQTMRPQFMLGQGVPQPAITTTPLVGLRPRSFWLKTWRRRLTQQRPFALQLAGAGILILLLVALSMLFAVWKPEQQRQIASTPTFEYPLATATPQLDGDWMIQVYTHPQIATPLATASLDATVRDTNTALVQSTGMDPALHLTVDEAPFAEVDKTKIARLDTNAALIAQSWQS